MLFGPVFNVFFKDMGHVDRWSLLSARNREGNTALDVVGQAFLTNFLVTNTTELSTEKVTKMHKSRYEYVFGLPPSPLRLLK